MVLTNLQKMQTAVMGSLQNLLTAIPTTPENSLEVSMTAWRELTPLC